MIKANRSNITIKDIESKVGEIDIISYYLGVNNIPTLICSPLRKDNNPSFGLFSSDGIHIKYKDFATKETGNLYNLLKQLWNVNFQQCLNRIYNDICLLKPTKTVVNKSIHKRIKATYKTISKIEVKVRNWKKHDIEYWESYGITLNWLKWAEVWPISHKIIKKGKDTYVFPADKYAYAYVEHKEGNTTIKVYQPFNKNGFKWSNNHDGSVISLWTKVPQTADKLVLCSSLKDALCLSANTKIPALALQGEGYDMSNTAIESLKSRYRNIYICFDNDPPGLLDGEKLSDKTGFKNVVLPHFNEGKDISDLRKALGKEEFIKIINPLFN